MPLHLLRRARHRQAPAPPPAAATVAPEPAAYPTYSETLAPAWLEAVSSLPVALVYKAESYKLLNPQPGMTLLDVGCGIGDDARTLAPLLAPGGRAIGVDADPQMIAAAKARQQASGSPIPIEFVQANGEDLPLAADLADIARLDRVLQHVQSPRRLLGEVERVLKPGGRVVLVEPDWGTVAVYPAAAGGGDDDADFASLLTRIVSTIAHPRIGRQLRALLHAAGFTEVEAHAVAYSTDQLAVADLGLELSATVEAAAGDPQIGTAALAWLAAAREADAAGDFFACLPLIFASASKRR